VTVSNVGCTWNGSSCTGGSSSTTAYRHDAAGRLIRALEQGVDLTEYFYDVAGKLVSVTQGSHTWTFSYDSLGYPIREETPETGRGKPRVRQA
jgi:YD repeat-containing protein